MAGNSFGQLFRITTFGESHGPGIGVVIDGCPSRLLIDKSFIASELARRRPGQSDLTTQRKETDSFEIISGVVDGQSTGAPIAIWIANKDQKPADYDHLADVYRPSHADYTYQVKYGVRDVRGGGRSSARETAARVAAGAIARQLLAKEGVEILGWVSQVGQAVLTDKQVWTREQVEQSIVRCPDPKISVLMEQQIREVQEAGDTLGGRVSCVVRNCPAGLGEPVFDKLHADLGKAILSINACKGFEIGSGFAAVAMRGSEHNDIFEKVGDQIRTRTNYSGGIQGGLSNGMDITFEAAFKPVSTLMQNQQSVDAQGEDRTITGKGRHDPCVVPRAVPIVEAMTALVVVDHLLRDRATRHRS